MPAQRGRPAAKKATPAKNVVTPEKAPEVPTEPAPASTPVVREETPEQKELRELREMVQALQAQQAASTAVNTEADVPGAEYKDGDKVLVHFVEDGWTAQGQVWYKGQELEFVVGEKAWKDTLDREGNSWILLTEEEQIDRGDKVFFRPGPWKGKGYKDAVWEKDGPPESELERADKLERERRRTAPTLPEQMSAE